MKINEFFQKGYYINLDRRTDRRAEFEQEVKRIGLEGFFERVPGVDGSNEPSELKKHNYCGASYAKIFKDANANGYERFLIFEDDIQFFDRDGVSGLELIEKALNQLQRFSDWDMIYFGCYTFDKTIYHVSENLISASQILTTHAIGYNKKGMHMYLQYNPFFHCPIDGWLGERKELTKYIVYPLAVIQRESRSDLDAWGWAPNAFHWDENFIKKHSKLIQTFEIE
jgi:GR25 family glycosyltransferase involved in LPS biosynthesis